MKILDKFVSAKGIEVTLAVYTTHWSHDMFSVDTYNPNSLFDHRERYLTYDNAFDSFFDIVEHLR